ncbi:MAG: substrate-binding domain-containing protein, partial [Planctomyces sp.]
MQSSHLPRESAETFPSRVSFTERPVAPKTTTELDQSRCRIPAYSGPGQSLILLILIIISSAGCQQQSEPSLKTSDPSDAAQNTKNEDVNNNQTDSGNPEAGDQKKIRICLLPKIKGISYFSSCAVGAEEAARELSNVELIYDGPIDGDARRQAEMIEQWTADGVDAICVAPNAPDVVSNAMKEAQEAGIKVLTWDADGLPGSRSFFVNQATARAIGEGMVQAMVNDLGPETAGDVVIISSDATSANQNAWIDVMKPALEMTKLKLQTIKFPGENSSNALADAQDVIRKYPNLKGIFG